METIIEQQQNLNFRAVTISDMNAILKLYQQKKTTSNIELSEKNSTLTNQFGLPFYVVELNNKIVGYSYATSTAVNDYSLNTTIDATFSNYSIDKSLIQESEPFFKKEWQNGEYKNLSVAITQLIKWLNNSNS